MQSPDGVRFARPSLCPRGQTLRRCFRVSRAICILMAELDDETFVISKFHGDTFADMLANQIDLRLVINRNRRQDYLGRSPLV